jgi:hypothetical protein
MAQNATAREFIMRLGAERGLPYGIIGDGIRAGLTKAALSDMPREEMISRFGNRKVAERGSSEARATRCGQSRTA